MPVIEYGHDVRVIEPCHGARFAIEAPERRVVAEVPAKHDAIMVRADDFSSVIAAGCAALAQ
jgi:hypothetical protein